MNRKCSFALYISIFLIIFVMAGCYQSTAEPELVTTTPSLPYPQTTPDPGRHRIVGTSVNGLPIVSFVLGQGPDVTLILATIHGDEPAGTPLVRYLRIYLQEHPYLMKGRTVVLLSVANPDGMAKNSRFNANGVDINRNFATDNRVNNKQFGTTAFSEPEARVIKQLIEKYSPGRIVSIHQPYGCIDYDGPGITLAVRLSQYCDLPIKRLGPKPGSLGSYAGITLGIPIITFEMLEDDSELDSEALWRRYGKALLAAIVYPELVK